MTDVNGFFGDYRFMSNFYIVPVVYDNELYKSSEHAYQAAKTFNNIKKKEIQEAATPNKAKYLGAMVSVRSDWEDVKEGVMLDIVTAKFKQNPELLKNLMDTEGYLEETNTWHDNFWGNCTCEACKDIEGKNILGEVLMHIRNEHFFDQPIIN